MSVSEDASTPAVTTTAGGSTATSLTSASFSPPAGTVLVAMCAVNWSTYPGSVPGITVSDTAGGTWTAGPVISTAGSFAKIAFFTRPVSSAPGSVTVTMSRGSDAGAAMLMLAVRVCAGAASSQSGAGSNTGSGSSTAMSGSVTTTAAGSLVYALGDSTGSGVPSANTGTTTIQSVHDTVDAGYLTSGKSSAVTGTPGSTSFGWTISISEAWVWAGLEILPGVSPGSADTAHGAEAGSVHATLAKGETGHAAESSQAGLPGGPVTFGIDLAGQVGNTQVGHGTIPPGQPGGAGGPGGPPAPNLGAGWEVKVLAAPDFRALLAVIPPKVLMTVQFAKQLKDLGSGTVTLNMDDSFWANGAQLLPNGQPAHYLLDYEHVWQVFQDGVCRFEFLGETVTEQLDDGSEQRIATVTGPGTAAALKWAMAAPPGFPGAIRYRLDAISDSFSETDGSGNLVLDTGLWNASAPAGHLSINPSGSARIMGSPGTTVLGTTAYDATNTLVSAQVSPVVSPDAAGNSLNGSQVTQMYVQSLANPAYYALFGLSATTFYAQLGGPSGIFTQTIASATAFAAAQAGNQDFQYWQIAEAGGQGGGSGTFTFYTSGDGQNWKQQYSIRHNWDARDCGLYFAARYSTDNTEAATVTGINSNVTTSSLSGPSYYSQPVIGGVWLDLLSQAKARGTVPFIATGRLSASTDSFGNPWTDSQSVQIANGTDLFTLLGAHAAMINADWVMQPGFLLQVGIPATGKITLGTDRSGQVIFRDGQDCTARVRTRTRGQISNLLGVINSDGRTITATDGTSVAGYGQREAWLQAAMQVTPADLAAVATAADLQNGTEVLSWTLQVSPWRAGRDIFNSYDVGDWIGFERPDFSGTDAVRVAAIAVQVNADGSETHELTLNSYIQWLAEQLNYIQVKLGGGFVNAAGTTAIAGSITSQNAPTVFSLTLGGLGDVTSGGPGGNAPLVYDPVTGQWVPAGSSNTITGSVPLSVGGTGGQVTIAGDGSQVTVSAPGAPPADAGAPAPPPAKTTISITTTQITDATGTTRTVIGAQPDGTYTHQDFNGGAPAAPDSPAVTAGPLSLVIGWDGLLGGALPLSDFLWAEVHVSTTSGFTPSTATLEGTMAAGGHSIVVGGLTAGTAYYCKLMARNTSGVAGNPSPQVSGSPSGTGSGAQVTFSATAPSSPGVSDLWGDTANGNEIKQWNGTAWVAYQWGTQAVSFTARGIGANTVTVANTAPTGPIAGDLWYDGTNGYKLNQWSGSAWTPFQYGTNAIAAGSVTAALIAAGTITATQIAAGTITGANIAATTVAAANIVAGTITTSQIAAGTITASNIAASTITGAKIAATTITAANIAAGTITASQIASGTITAGLLAASIVVAGIVDGTTISGATLLLHGTSGDELVYAGTPAAGNLLMAVSPEGGTDSFANSWDQGVTLIAISGLTNLFSVQDTSGNTLANIDSSGNINGQVISAAADVLVAGQSILSDLVGPAPQGLLNYGFMAVGSTAWPSTAIGTTETSLFEIDQAVTAGRIYEFVMNPTIINVSGAESAHLKLRYTTDGTTPTTASSNAATLASRVETGGSDALMGSLKCMFFPVADGTYRFLVTGFTGSGTYQFKNDNFIRIEVFDWGEDTGGLGSGNNLTVLGSGTGGGSGAQANTEYFYPSSTRSYYSDLGLRNTNGNMYHGAYSGESGYQYSYIQWAAGTLGNSLSTVLNYTVSKVSLRLDNLHSWFNNGMTWGLHSSTTLGGAVGTYSVLLGGFFISEGNMFDFALGSTEWAPFKAGGTVYTVLGPDSSDEFNLNWYGYFYGGGGSDSFMPRMTVVYSH